MSQVTSSGSDYYDFDALGSTAGITNATSGLVASYSYSPFGGLTLEHGERLQSVHVSSASGA